MRKTVCIAVVLVLIMTCFCGCSKNTDKKPDGVSAEDNFTEENVSDSALELRIMGNRVTLPCSFSEFPNLRVDENTLFNCTENSVYGMLYYDDYRIGRIVLEDCQVGDKDLGDKTVSLISICPDREFDGFDFSYLGLPLSTPREDVIGKLGVPDEVNGNYILYGLGDGGHYARFAFATNYLSIKKLTICVADNGRAETGINRFYDTFD